MGCTSSTPNMAVPRADATDKNITFAEETEKNIEKESVTGDDNEINVLPTCDNNLEESIELVRNKCVLSSTDLENDKDFRTNGHVLECDTDKIHDVKDTVQAEEKLSTLEEVVEKVVEMYVAEHLESNENVTEMETPKELKDTTKEVTKKDSDEPQNESSGKKEEHPKEANSPSQSESSRATRWEALADIAAELPPSLAVDPLTGQIYTLSK